MNEAYWSNRYNRQDTGWNIGQPAPPLIKYLQKVPVSTSILIPGCGHGHEALFLAKMGYQQVTVLDIAAEPLQHLQSQLPPGNHVQLVKANFFDHHAHYDLMVEQTFFCALEPTLRKAYALHSQQLLSVKQGKLMGLLFDRSFDINPPFGGSKEEYQLLFKNYFTRLHLEPCYNSIPARQGSELFMELQVK